MIIYKQKGFSIKGIFNVLVFTVIIMLPLKSFGQSLPGLNKMKSTTTISYKFVAINNIKVFYREAGIGNKITILFLHGFPSSSYMYRNLLENLSDSFHVIAPDYPGFGYTVVPSAVEYDYTFDNLSETIESFIEKLGLKDIHLYMQDYGGPVGFGIASKNPRLVKSLIIQNANAYKEGFGEITIPFQNYFKNPTPENEKEILGFLSFEGTKFQYLDGAKDSTKISPDGYFLDSYLMNRQGNAEIQLKLFRDYQSNVDKYESWQGYFRKHQPSALIIWGENDKIFIKEGAIAYTRDLPKAEIHFFNGGHFMLEEYSSEVGMLIRKFINQ